ncbi:sigma-54-dependent Fis family transcriptional regulator [Ideonella sp. B7]|uniref:sigma-54-dependent Fis family transcriptional regulator n=1 Tax=Ideonella benzenivorans TaxID=2831643 RepID=UPI002873C16B|nr:sigma-54-dependent Fis family transcriptional regulator [Ideonella benzenivorans]MCA6217288.1 sigma-54-dependent Fis family transcriptional regulator [Ideonella benzenivorans]
MTISTGEPSTDEHTGGRAGGWTSPTAEVRARVQRIEQSHLRCAALGLSRVERPDFEPMLRGDLSVARDRNLRLLSRAAPVMELLLEQIVNTESMIALTDAQGTVLHTVGDDGFMGRAHKVALSPGVNWAEQSKGTNAVGTALVEERPTLVHATEHFMHVNSFMTCSAAPIFDPRGNILGVLDVSGDQRSYHQHTMGLVRMSARMIENHWLTDDSGDRLRLHFHIRPEFIGTLLEGIVVIAPDGRIQGANRAALDLLDMSSAAVRLHTLESLFNISAGMLVDHLRAPLAQPMRLQLSNGRQLHASPRISGALHRLTPVAEIPLGTEPLTGAAQAAEVSVMPAARAAAPESVALRADPLGGESRLSGLHYLATGDAQIEAVVRKVQRVLNRDIPLMILGETGTGKELLARAVHQDSERAKQPFVAVNCASIPETLIEAELFGYEEGAFTGARRKGATGRIVQANGGTLFLDEIGDMPLGLQAHLLRVLQERCVTPLGSQKSIPVDIAVVSATHRDLRGMIEQGKFREDLYYRLNGLVVRLPALRDRSDLAVVARRILSALGVSGSLEISPAVMAMFLHYHWPGNVRQLATVLRTAAVMAAGEPLITEQHLSDDFLDDVRRQMPAPAAAVPSAAPRPVERPVWAAAPWAARGEPVFAEPAAAVPASAVAEPAPAGPRTLGEAEIDLIRAAVEAAQGNISLASKQLGISRNTIYRKLRWTQKL